MKKLVSSGSYLENSIGFSRACRIGNQIAVAGTAPIKDGKTVFVGNVYHRLSTAWKSLSAQLKKLAGVLET